MANQPTQLDIYLEKSKVIEGAINEGRLPLEDMLKVNIKLCRLISHNVTSFRLYRAPASGVLSRFLFFLCRYVLLQYTLRVFHRRLLPCPFHE